MRSVSKTAFTAQGSPPLCRSHRLDLGRRGIAQDARARGGELLTEGTGVVVQTILLTDGLDAGRHFRVTVGRNVRVQMVLNLITQMPAHNVHPATAGEVTGTQQLPIIPVAAGLVLTLFLGEGLRLLGEVATKDHR